MASNYVVRSLWLISSFLCLVMWWNISVKVRGYCVTVTAEHFLPGFQFAYAYFKIECSIHFSFFYVSQQYSIFLDAIFDPVDIC